MRRTSRGTSEVYDTAGTLARWLRVHIDTVRAMDDELMPLRTPGGVRLYLRAVTRPKAQAILQRRRWYRRRQRARKGAS